MQIINSRPVVMSNVADSEIGSVSVSRMRYPIVDVVDDRGPPVPIGDNGFPVVPTVPFANGTAIDAMREPQAATPAARPTTPPPAPVASI